MKKQISPKIIALTFGILVISFLMAFYVVAWTEPTSAPPGDNVATPLNAGPAGQSKTGGLILNTGDATHDPAEYGLIVDQGQICLGENCISNWTEAGTGGAVVTFRMEATSYQVGNEYFAKTVSYNCPGGGNVVNISCGAKMVDVRGDPGCTEDPCPSFTQANSCSCSGSGDRATLVASVVKYGGNCSDCTYGHTCAGYWVTNYCTPSLSRDMWGRCTYQYDCYLPGGSPQCTMEFQCGIKQTVGN